MFARNGTQDWSLGVRTRMQYANHCLVTLYVLALFMVNFSHLHYNVVQRGCQAISGYNHKVARNCPAYTLDFIVMQISKVNREKNYSHSLTTKYHYVLNIHSIFIKFEQQNRFGQICHLKAHNHSPLLNET